MRLESEIVIVLAAVCGAGCGNRHTTDLLDGGVPDAGDGGFSDAGDAGLSDAGSGDAGLSDAGDAGFSDAGDAGSGIDAGDAGPWALNVLFIGDSYTYVNDLPGMLTQIAATAGIPPTIATAEAVQGGSTLEVLWDLGTPVDEIAKGHWTHVVLQGESGEPLLDSADFDTYAQLFENLVIGVGAQPALFVTWARAAGWPVYGTVYSSPDGFSEWGIICPAQMQDVVTLAYANLAQQQPDDLLVCVGPAFQLALQQHPEIALYQTDFTHPTVAGTYLAASTFYVALTGQPVPPQSAVPAGVSAQEAAELREIAQIGSNCAHVQPKGAIVLSSDVETWRRSYDGPADGGSLDGGVFDYGTVGTSIPMYFGLTNYGWGGVGAAIDIADGMTLAPPFAWADGIGYPGGSGTVEIDASPTPFSYPFCSSSLPATPDGGYPITCVVAVSYTGATNGTGLLTLNLTNAYESSVAIALQGTSTTRALLTISDDTGFFGCTDAICGPVNPWGTTSLNLLVSNRGGSPTTSLGIGAPLGSGLQWGPGGDAGSFPGGTGMGSMGGQNYEYCTTQTLGAGQQCMITVVVPCVYGAAAPGVGAANLAYSDSSGPVSPNANRNIEVPLCTLP
jgi:hypothetical protein